MIKVLIAYPYPHELTKQLFHYPMYFFSSLVSWLILFTLPASLAGAVKTHSADEACVVEMFSKLRAQPHYAVLIPPEGWTIADPQFLPKSVSLMVVGKGKKEFPPSINLAREAYTGSLEEYLKLVKEINKAQGNTYKSLGSIEIGEGKAALGQVDTTNEWGKIRMLHLFFLKDKMMHIVTAAAAKEEFSQFRPLFLQSIRTLHINGNVFDMVTDEARKKKLGELCEEFKKGWMEYLESTPQEIAAGEKIHQEPLSQQPLWLSFQMKIDKEFADMGKYWKEALLNALQQEVEVAAINSIPKAPLQSPSNLPTNGNHGPNEKGECKE